MAFRIADKRAISLFGTNGMIANRPNPKDGIIQVPQGPGFGVELDWDMVKRYRVN